MLAGGFVLLGLHFAQEGIEALEPCFPELAITFEPLAGFREWAGFEAARPALGVTAAGNQSRAFEHLEMLRDRRLAHVERLGKIVYGGFARCQPSQNRPAGGIGEGGKGCVQVRRRLTITRWLHNVVVIYKGGIDVKSFVSLRLLLPTGHASRGRRVDAASGLQIRHAFG